ncbi:MAG: hypothetical protein NTZ05_15390, partial [Chloroflexi bacterium]|nr:hypothetical protein [Chloroflexota bacterium]
MSDPSNAHVMAVNDQLDYLAQGSLQQMTKALETQPAVKDRAGYIDALAAVVGTDYHRKVLERRLSPRDWQLLTLLPVQNNAVRLRVLIGALRIGGAKPEAASAQVAALLQLGCLLPVDVHFVGAKLNLDARTLMNGANRAFFKIVPEVAAWAKRHAPAPTLAAAEPPATLMGPELLDLQRAFFVVLTELGRTPLRLTTAGIPNKVDLNRLAKTVIGAMSGAVPKGTVETPPLLWFTLSALAGAGVLVQTEDDRLEPAPNNGFLQAPLVEQVRRL